MFNEIIDYKNQKRRKDSMIKNGFGTIKYLLVLALLVVAPIKSWAGVTFPNIPDTDFLGETQLFYFWDLRDRASYFQVTNTTTLPITVHIQIFNSNDNCSEFDFDDTFTGNDTHLYNLSALDSNDGTLTGPPVFTNKDFGMVVVTEIDAASGDETLNFDLIGNFRIVDNGGYEYRTNAPGLGALQLPEIENIITTANEFVNFNNVRADNASDVVGIVVAHQPGTGTVSPVSGTVLAGSAIFAVFTPTIYNAAEKPNSCSLVAFVCGDPSIASSFGTDVTAGFDLGVNAKLPNSKGGDNICNTTDGVGFLAFDNSIFGIPLGNIAPADTFVGLIGLNNGKSGSMDSFWALPFPPSLTSPPASSVASKRNGR